MQTRLAMSLVKRYSEDAFGDHQYETQVEQAFKLCLSWNPLSQILKHPALSSDGADMLTGWLDTQAPTKILDRNKI